MHILSVHDKRLSVNNKLFSLFTTKQSKSQEVFGASSSASTSNAASVIINITFLYYVGFLVKCKS